MSTDVRVSVCVGGWQWSSEVCYVLRGDGFLFFVRTAPKPPHEFGVM